MYFNLFGILYQKLFITSWHVLKYLKLNFNIYLLQLKLNLYSRDLYNAIAAEDFPSWTFAIQLMTFKQAENWEFNPFDVTKVGLV